MRGVHVRTAAFVLAACLVPAGCEHLAPARVVPPPGCDPTYSQYHLDTFQWTNVARVLVLPFANEAGGRADEEINRALRAELQQLGRFEVVAAPPAEIAACSTTVHRSGRFDEAAMLHLARAYRADVILHGTITEYSPYPRPRIGIVLQAVAPGEAKVVASVDGLWDANHLPIAKRAQNYYMQRKKQRGPYEEANWIWPDDGHADELALLSPQLYQRWVCSELAAILVQDPAVVGTVFAPHGTKAVTPVKRTYEIPGTPVTPGEAAKPDAKAAPKTEQKMPPAKP
jgi:hypothetical protein